VYDSVMEMSMYILSLSSAFGSESHRAMDKSHHEKINQLTNGERRPWIDNYFGPN
jgi:hypothetical protein